MFGNLTPVHFRVGVYIVAKKHINTKFATDSFSQPDDFFTGFSV